LSYKYQEMILFSDTTGYKFGNYLSGVIIFFFSNYYYFSIYLLN